MLAISFKNEISFHLTQIYRPRLLNTIKNNVRKEKLVGASSPEYNSSVQPLQICPKLNK